jgi:hypothetical protein
MDKPLLRRAIVLREYRNVFLDPYKREPQRRVSPPENFHIAQVDHRIRPSLDGRSNPHRKNTHDYAKAYLSPQGIFRKH